MSFADNVSLELDGMKSPESPEGSPEEEKSEPMEEKASEGSGGEMALEAIKKNDGEALAEAIRVIMGG